MDLAAGLLTSHEALVTAPFRKPEGLGSWGQPWERPITFPISSPPRALSAPSEGQLTFHYKIFGAFLIPNKCKYTNERVLKFSGYRYCSQRPQGAAGGEGVPRPIRPQPSRQAKCRQGSNTAGEPGQQGMAGLQPRRQTRSPKSTPHPHQRPLFPFYCHFQSSAPTTGPSKAMHCK